MAFLIQNSVIVNDQREIIGVSTAGINTALYVGSDIQMDGAAGVITASSFVGSGIGLTGINANVIVSDGIPTGISTTEGDLYYDSTDLKLFTYYDNNWVEASPVPPGATTLEVTNEAGITTAQIDLLSETLILSGTGNEIEVGVNSSTNTLTFGLTNDVSIGGSITAGNKFYGDGSELEGISLDPTADLITTGDIQAGVITATTSLEATASSGVGLTVTSDAFIGGNAFIDNIRSASLSVANEAGTVPSIQATAGGAVDLYFGAGVPKIQTQATGANVNGTLKILGADGGLEVQTGVSTFIGDIRANGNIIGDGATNISGINSVTATNFYGSGEFLTDIEGTAILVNSQDYGAATGDLPMPFLSAVGAGASIYTDMAGTEDFTYDPANGILKAKEFDALSDMRFKTDIVNIEDALGKVAELRGVEYNWKNGTGSSVGVIAQELQEVYPQLVSETEERLTVNYNGLVGLLIAAVNEISAELAELKAQK